MKFFNIFFEKKQKKVDDLGLISDKIYKLQRKQMIYGTNEKDEKEITNLKDIIKSNLFNALKTRNFNKVINILKDKKISKDYLINEKGYNAVVYSLYNDDLELFKVLFEIQDFIGIYFYKQIPTLFTIVLNRKNFDLIKFFLENKDLGFELKKENITNCLFIAIQNNKRDLIDIIIKNYSDFLDSRNIEASLIYSISYNQVNELKTIFSYPELTSKFSSKTVENLTMISIMNKNMKALELIVGNHDFIKAIEKVDADVLKNILQTAYNQGNVLIINAFLSNNILRNTANNILMIKSK